MFDSEPTAREGGREGADEPTAERLLGSYLQQLRDAIEAVGADRVVAETDLDPDDVERLRAGNDVALELRAAATVLSLRSGAPDAEALLAEARDELLLAMSTAAMGVDRLAARMDADRSPREVQAMVEGRLPMTLREYATIAATVSGAGGR